MIISRKIETGPALKTGSLPGFRSTDSAGYVHKMNSAHLCGSCVSATEQRLRRLLLRTPDGCRLGLLCNPACSLNRLPLLSAYQRKLFLFLLIRILLVVLHSQRIFYQRSGFHVFSLVKRTATILKNWPNPTQRYSVLLIQEVWKIRQLGKYSHKIQVSRPWLRRVAYIFFT